MAICCRLTISPLDNAVACSILAIGQFVAQDAEGHYWIRKIPEEGTEVTVTLTPMLLQLNLSPTVSDMAGHRGKRIAASIYFEIAAKYAEKVNGTITQHANVVACIADGINERILAVYPTSHLDFEAICPGFKAELQSGQSDAAGV